MYISGTTHICNQHQIEVGMTIDLEPNSTPSQTRGTLDEARWPWKVLEC
ncbi:hypothetical protein Hanom_Chr16g01421181 [Helianthus anomalus]